MYTRHFIKNPARRLLKLSSRNAANSDSNSTKALDDNSQRPPPSCNPDSPNLYKIELKFAEHEKEFAQFKKEFDKFKEETEKKFVEQDKRLMELEECLMKLEIRASYVPFREIVRKLLENTEEARTMCEKITGGRKAVVALKDRLDKIIDEEKKNLPF